MGIFAIIKFYVKSILLNKNRQTYHLTLDLLKLISRKIPVLENFLNFHTVGDQVSNILFSSLFQTSETASEDMEKWRNKHSVYCVEKMYGITVASDCLLHYVERVPEDGCGLNMLGILLEREQHLR